MKRRALRTLSLTACLWMGIIVPRAAAAPTTQEKTSARQLVKQGRAAVQGKRLEEALRLFRQAYALWPRKEIRFNIALVCHQMGRTLEAARELHLFLKNSAPEDRQRIPPFLQRIMQEVGVLSVSVTPASVEIRVNGRTIGRGAVEHVVRPGRHVVTFYRNGKEVGRKQLEVDAGRKATWQHRVVAVKRPPPPRPRIPPPPPPPTKQRGVHWAWFAVTAGLTVAAGAAVIGVGLETREFEEQWQTTYTRDVQEKGRRYRTATNAMIGVTAAGAIAAAVLVFYTRWKKERSPVTGVTPTFGPGGAGVVVRW